MAVPVDLPRGAVAFTVPFVMAFAVAFAIAIAFGPQKSGLSHRVQKMVYGECVLRQHVMK